MVAPTISVGKEGSCGLDLWGALEARLQEGAFGARQLPGVEIKLVTSFQGNLHVMRHPRSGEFIRVGDVCRQVYDKLDGRRSANEIALILAREGYLATTGEVSEIIKQFEDKGFAARPQDRVWSPLAGRIGSPNRWHLGAWARRLMEISLPIRNIDASVAWLYHRLGWLLTNPRAAVVVTIMAATGAAFFVHTVASRGLAFVQTGGSIGLGLVFLWILRGVHIVVHETAHAVALKHFGGTVREGGVMLYLGNPAFYVDTTEAWYLPPWQRITVAAVGPLASVIVGSLSALVGCVLPLSGVADLMLKMAFISYISAVINLCPFLELDGYHILTDYLDTPNLRRDALRWWGDRLKGKSNWLPRLRKDWGLMAFGALSAVWAVLLVGASLTMWTRLAVQIWTR